MALHIMLPLKCELHAVFFATQMVQFIKQEAEEKANEISVAAEEVRCWPACGLKDDTSVTYVPSSRQ